MFSLTYEFKLKPTFSQVSLFEDWLEQCRRVYNYALAERKAWYSLVVAWLMLVPYIPSTYSC